MRALVVHPGTQHAFRLAGQLQRHGCLSRFWTGFAFVPDSMFSRCVGSLPLVFQRRLSSRRLNGVPAEKLRIQPRVDLRAIRQLRAGRDEQAVMFERNAVFQRRIPGQEFNDSDLVIGVDTASWLLAERASSLGRPYILDRTIGHPRAFEQLSPILREKFPEWIEKGPRRLPSLLSAEDTEHALASKIVVGSSFTRRTLIENGVPAEKIVVIPLGVDLDAFRPVARPESHPLRFLFLGILGARKGLPLLLEAWRSLGRVDAELLLAGPVNDRVAGLIPPMPGLRVLGKVSRRDLPKLLHQCDVLVFPSFFEGFGAVLLEAMAAGLPVIATDSTGAPDLITQGVEGFVIPTGDGEALRDAMHRLITSPSDLAPMSVAARRCAERHSWDAYGDRWMEILGPISDLGSLQVASEGIQQAVVASTAPKRTRSGNDRVKALLVHPGTQYSFQLARQLQLHGCLSRFWTGMAYVPGSALGYYVGRLPASIQRRLANRSLAGVPVENLRTRPFGEFQALRRLRAGHDDQSVMYRRNAAFQYGVPERELLRSDVLIGFDTSSWLMAERASELGRKFILDRSIGHPLCFDRVLQTLRQQFPEWVDEVPLRHPELLRAEAVEHREADRIVVPSSFVRGTLIEQGIPAEKITVIPFGVDLGEFRVGARYNGSRPLRFVFLGSIGARKGAPLLLQAWRALAPTNAELWLVGSVSERHARLIPSLPGLRLIGKLPHRELPAMLAECDVLVFPSYFEGLAQVQLEAMAAGLPIIGTEASGAADLITDGEEGYLIPVGDVDALCAALQRFIDTPGDLPRMSSAARLAAERFSWGAYGNRWMDLLQQVV